MQLFPAISEVKVECSGCGDVLKIVTSIFVSNNCSHHSCCYWQLTDLALTCSVCKNKLHMVCTHIISVK